jgi:hypothetical protein
MNEQKVVRLAIDFIVGTQYPNGVAWSALLRGSLRWNSTFETSVPVGSDADK